MTFMVDSTRLVSLESVKDAIKKKYEDSLSAKNKRHFVPFVGQITFLFWMSLMVRLSYPKDKRREVC